MLWGTTTTEWVAEGRTAQAFSGTFQKLSGSLLASIRAAGEHATQPGQGSEKRAAAAARRVLLVDDDEDVLAIMVPFLEEEGYQVTTASTGREALRLVGEVGPDVVILDLMMPVVSGWDVWDHMQQSPDLSKVPVVVFTACGLSQGAFGAAVPVVRKGASTDEILGAINRSLGA